MPFWGTGSNRSNNSTSEGGKSEVHISISTEAAASATQSKRGGAASAEEERRMKLENDRLEMALDKARQDKIDAYHQSLSGNL